MSPRTKSGKVEYERERLLGITNKFIIFLAIPSSLSRSYSTFPLCSWTTLIEIAVYKSLTSTGFNRQTHRISLHLHPQIIIHVIQCQRRRNIDNWGGGGGGRYSYIRVHRL